MLQTIKRLVSDYRVFLMTLLLAFGATGCASAFSGVFASRTDNLQPAYAPSTNFVYALASGDMLEITFFGTPDLNTMQRIRADGKISAKLFGDVQAAGKSVMELQNELYALYESQLQVKAISVIVQSAAVIYVAGQVIRPGPVPYLRPTTPIDAIMECGGFSMWADSGKVRVIRREENRLQTFVLNCDQLLSEGEGATFFLKTFDTVYVPESKW